jgi:hypothetical protein
MDSLLGLVAIIAFWIVVQTWVFPKLGVPT